jgi:hypothetical protein
VAALEAGPVGRPELDTVVRPGDVVAVDVTGDVAEVAVSDAFTRRTAADRQLAAAQVVLTLTTAPLVEQVRFTHAGVALPVPNGAGLPVDGPLTAADFQSLLAPG